MPAYQANEKSVLEQLSDLKDFIQGAKSSIIVETEELVKLQEQLRDLQMKSE